MRTLIAACLLLVFAGSAHAADFSDPDWPCVQRKVPHLSVAQMWAGPAISDADLKDWRKIDDVSGLAKVLAVRRTTEAEAEDLIQGFSEGAENDNLRLLFAGAFSLIERERSEIIRGIARYARKQTALSEAIESTQNTLSDLKAIKDPDFDTQDRIEEIEDKLIWDTRIFKDRQQSLTYVCETPVILERRAFALARAIMGQLK